jgi:hypothetical protein
MRIIPSALVLGVAIFLSFGLTHLVASDEDGVALAIVYDTSGSMKDMVPSSKGAAAPKYVIANRALLAIVKQIQTFATNGTPDAPRKVYTGLFTFDKGGAKEVVKMGPFDADAIKNFANGFSTPNGNTPLGNSLRTAAQAVLDSPASRKHVLVITDGMNTSGPDPADVLPEIHRRADRKQSLVFVHFIAFDVNASVFEGVKKQGASVAAAADETQLNSQLDFILQNQILLERPTKTK